MIADELAAHGHEVAVVEQRDIGWGSSAASTALLQYEIDTHMLDLAKRYGEADAVLAYRQCAEAIAMLQDKARGIRDVDFAWADSLYYASKYRHARVLRDEFNLRLKHGFQVELLEPEALQENYRIDAPAAILSHQAARIDPYRMAYRLLARLEKRGSPVFDRTHIAVSYTHLDVYKRQNRALHRLQSGLSGSHLLRQAHLLSGQPAGLPRNPAAL